MMATGLWIAMLLVGAGAQPAAAAPAATTKPSDAAALAAAKGWLTAARAMDADALRAAVAAAASFSYWDDVGAYAKDCEKWSRKVGRLASEDFATLSACLAARLTGREPVLKIAIAPAASVLAAATKVTKTPLKTVANDRVFVVVSGPREGYDDETWEVTLVVAAFDGGAKVTLAALHLSGDPPE
jgi:hypothetical protein